MRVVTSWLVIHLLVFAVALLIDSSNPPAIRADTTFTVNTTVDAADANPGDGVCATADGQCSLRAAIQETNALPGSDTIQLPGGTYELTIEGRDEDTAATGDLDILDDLSISGTGPGAAIVDAGHRDRVFDSYATFAVDHLTIRGGDEGVLIDQFGGGGGGIYARWIDKLTELLVTDSTITGNTGGIYTNQRTTIERSTIYGNELAGIMVGESLETVVTNSTLSENDGPGIMDILGYKLVLRYNTIVSNTATGIAMDYLALNQHHLAGNIIAYNGPFPSGRNCFYNAGELWPPMVTSGGGNIVSDTSCLGMDRQIDAAGIDPLVLPLSGNGGPTLTHGLLAHSPAINLAASCSEAPATDQRGFGRPVAGGCDAGALEYEYAGNTAPDPAATFTVDTVADAADKLVGDGVCSTPGDSPGKGHCSLRAAIQESNTDQGRDVIAVPAGTYALTLAGPGEDASATGDLDIRSDVAIYGDAAGETIIDGNGTDSVFDITGYQSRADLRRLTIRNGGTGGWVDPLQGNGIWLGGGSLYLVDSSVVGNQFHGIEAWGGTATIAGSTITRNGSTGIMTSDMGARLSLTNTIVSDNAGAGIIAYGELVASWGGWTQLMMNFTTITGNNGGVGVSYTAVDPAAEYPKAIDWGQPIASVDNSIIWGNGANDGEYLECPQSTPDVNGTSVKAHWVSIRISDSIIPGGDCSTFGERGNLPFVDPLLLPMPAPDGTLLRNAPMLGSPAIDDHHWMAGCPPIDQAGNARSRDGNGDSLPACDLGAIEYQPGSSTALPPTFTVNTGEDAADASLGDGVCATEKGTCSLRAAIQEANHDPGFDVIDVPPAGGYALTQWAGEAMGTGDGYGDLDITDDVAIVGSVKHLTVITSSNHDNVFEVHAPAIAELYGLRIEGAALPTPAGAAGIVNDIGATLFVIDSLVIANNPNGISSRGSATIARSTIMANKNGVIVNGGTLTLSNATVAGNVYDGVLVNDVSSAEAPRVRVNISNTTVSANGQNAVEARPVDAPPWVAAINSIFSGSGTNCDVSATPILSLGGNFDSGSSCGFIGSTDHSNTDPMLAAAPADNGGPTRTIALLPGSPAIDGGSDVGCTSSDERGGARELLAHAGSAGDLCDAGAYEVQAGVPDADGDGDPDTWDCAPADAAIHHGAVEVAHNGLDDDCSSATPDNNAPVLAPVGDQAAVYSDLVSVVFSATDADGDKLSFSENGAPANLSLADDGDGHATLSGTMDAPAAAYSVQIQVDDGYGGVDVEGFMLAVGRESVTLKYDGDAYVPGPTANKVVNLHANVTEDSDGSFGDLSHAAVIFDICDAATSSTCHSVGPVPVISSGGQGSGEASASDILTDGAYSVVVRAEPDNHFYTGPSSQPGTVAVATVVNGSTSGGGWVLDGAGQHGHFAFAVKSSKKGMLQGQSMYAYYADGFDWVIKSNSWTDGGLSFPEVNRSTFMGNCSVTAYDPATGLAIGSISFGNATCKVDVVDNGRSDSYAIVVKRRGGTDFHSVHGDIGGGNIVVRPPG